MLEAISLFFGAFLDATIGPNLFVPGEPFLLAAGYQLHQGVIWGVVAVLLGGFGLAINSVTLLVSVLALKHRRS